MSSYIAAVIASTTLALPVPGLTEETPSVRIVEDFVAEFAGAQASGALDVSAGSRQTSDGIVRRGIFLHPRTRGDAILTFPAVTVPAASVPAASDPGRRPFLTFDIGFRDGISWTTTPPGPNGVRFRVRVAGEDVFDERAHGKGWRPRAVDLSRWRGQSVLVEFCTSAIDGDSSYDWSVFARPMIVTLSAARGSGVGPGTGIGAGMAVARIRCEKPSRVRIGVGESQETVDLATGRHWVPFRFRGGGESVFEVLTGEATLEGGHAGFFRPEIVVEDLLLSSPLVLAGRPLRVIAKLRNRGLGSQSAGESLRVSWSLKSQGSLQTGALGLKVGRLEPQAERFVMTDPFSLPRVGRLSVRCAGTSTASDVFPPTPRLERDGGFQSTVTAAGARLRLVRDRGQAYALAETWAGEVWRRAGAIYPLARVIVRNRGGEVEERRLRVRSVEGTERTLRIAAVAESSARGEPRDPWPVLLEFQAESEAPRIRCTATLSCPRDGELLAFYGPSILAGEGASGARKDFALFPGLEYLEGDEPSSSERDLAYPLNDRRVPAAHKIATPLIAVENDAGLIALLWDARQEWKPGTRRPAARFLAPAVDSGLEYVHMSLFVPSVGEHVPENGYQASRALAVRSGDTLRLVSQLVLDHASNYDGEDPTRIVRGPIRGGLLLQAMRHYFDVYGLPEPSPAPRSWEEEKALSRHAYFTNLWSEDPPGWSHCQGWAKGGLIGHSVPLLMDARDAPEPGVRKEIERRVSRMLEHHAKGPAARNLWRDSGCHIVFGELPFFRGRLGTAMQGLRDHALARLRARENGLWVWRPAGKRHQSLGKPGDHTLGQAALNAMQVLRSARLTGDPELRARALEAMRQMERYRVPRGAQTWECPLYQPDILASAYAVRAYCEAYRMTSDPEHLARARHWAWSGLPFLYMWEMDAYPTMRYNVIAVMGSTFFDHSWLGLPVVWCGMVYAYSLLDLAQFDPSFDWKRVARGILRSAQHQQYTEGPSKGCYPDSWSLIDNAPRPADINPENILMVGFRLRGPSPHIRFARLDLAGSTVHLNSGADIVSTAVDPDAKRVRFALKSTPGFGVHTMLAPVPRPHKVRMGKRELASVEEDRLDALDEGWGYHAPLKAIVLKTTPGDGPGDGAVSCEIVWE